MSDKLVYSEINVTHDYIISPSITLFSEFFILDT